MSQLSIFGNRKCLHCTQDPGMSPVNPHLWNGFRDADTGQYVCWKCREYHYRVKMGAAAATTFSEVPVMLYQIN